MCGTAAGLLPPSSHQPPVPPFRPSRRPNTALGLRGCQCPRFRCRRKWGQWHPARRTPKLMLSLWSKAPPSKAPPSKAMPWRAARCSASPSCQCLSSPRRPPNMSQKLWRGPRGARFGARRIDGPAPAGWFANRPSRRGDDQLSRSKPSRDNVPGIIISGQGKVAMPTPAKWEISGPGAPDMAAPNTNAPISGLSANACWIA